MNEEQRFQAQLDFQSLLQISSPLNFAFADYFSSLGDDRVKNHIRSFVKAHIEKYGLSPESLISDIDRTFNRDNVSEQSIAQEIFEQALKEIEQDE